MAFTQMPALGFPDRRCDVVRDLVAVRLDPAPTWHLGN
jgi:hypothetical protein